MSYASFSLEILTLTMTMTMTFDGWFFAVEALWKWHLSTVSTTFLRRFYGILTMLKNITGKMRMDSVVTGRNWNSQNVIL